MKFKTFVTIFVVLWVICGFVASGFIYADNRATLHFGSNRSEGAFCVGWGISGGPISLGISLFVTGFWEHGWKLPCT